MSVRGRPWILYDWDGKPFEQRGVIWSGFHFRRISPAAKDTQRRGREDGDEETIAMVQALIGVAVMEAMRCGQIPMYVEGRTSIVRCWLNVECKRRREKGVEDDSQVLSLSNRQDEVATGDAGSRPLGRSNPSSRTR